MQVMLKAEHRQIRVQLVGMARSGNITGSKPTLDTPIHIAQDGYRMLTFQWLTTVDAMRERLAKTSKHWQFYWPLKKPEQM